MNRTQLYLEKRHMDLLRKRAQAEHISVSEAIRRIVDAELARSTPAPKEKPASLMHLAKRVCAKGDRAPADLATNLDHYAYE
jgi:hypothetical protein